MTQATKTPPTEPPDSHLYRSVSEELDQRMEVVNTKAWLALLTCFGLLIVILLWAFRGSIPINVSGLGVMLSTEGAYIIVAQTSGTVIDVRVEPGQQVKEGDVLAELADPENDLKIKVQKQRVANLEKELADLENRFTNEDKLRVYTIEQKIESVELAKLNVEHKIPYLEKDLESKTKLTEKGILARPDLEKAKSDLASARTQIESYQAELAGLKADLAANPHATELIAKRTEIFNAKKDLELLMLQNSFKEIKSVRTGRIIEVNVSEGKRVEAGQIIASIELPVEGERKLEFYALIGGEYGALLRPGLKAQIQIAGIDAKQYGYLVGVIESVSPYPVSQAEILTTIPNPELAQYLKGQQQAVYIAIIRLQISHESLNGFQWTTRLGPPLQVTSGTLGVARIVVEERRPMYYILPQEVTTFVKEYFPFPNQ